MCEVRIRRIGRCYGLQRRVSSLCGCDGFALSARNERSTEQRPLQDRVDLLLDHNAEQHPGLRRMAPHLMGIGTAAEFVQANHPHLHPATTHA